VTPAEGPKRRLYDIVTVTALFSRGGGKEKGGREGYTEAEKFLKRRANDREGRDYH